MSDLASSAAGAAADETATTDADHIHSASTAAYGYTTT